MRPAGNPKRRPRNTRPPLFLGGFTLIEIMIVLLVIGLLLAMALPNFIQSREKTQLNICFNNLRQISAAKNQWAVENNQAEGAVAALADLEPYFKGGTVKVFCAQDSTRSFSSSYEIQSVGTEPTCKIQPVQHKL